MFLNRPWREICKGVRIWDVAYKDEEVKVVEYEIYVSILTLFSYQWKKLRMERKCCLKIYFKTLND